jgi:hypothetical protein
MPASHTASPASSAAAIKERVASPGGFDPAHHRASMAAGGYAWQGGAGPAGKRARGRPTNVESVVETNSMR